jgi:hypothetical protein
MEVYNLGPRFKMERAIIFSLKLHLLLSGLCLLFLTAVAKILNFVHSKKMKETVSEGYCPTDKPPSDSWSFISSYVCKEHAL